MTVLSNDLAAVCEIAEFASHASNLDELFAAALDRFLRLTGMEMGGVIRLDPAGRFDLRVQRGLPEAVTSRIQGAVPPPQSVPALAIERCQLMVVQDAAADPRELDAWQQERGEVFPNPSSSERLLQTARIRLKIGLYKDRPGPDRPNLRTQRFEYEERKIVMHRSMEECWSRRKGVLGAIVAGALLAGAMRPALAQQENQPAPPSIGADVPLVYFGPAPSTVQKELIGPHQLLTAGQVDTNAGTVTLPLYQGRMRSGEKVWYILTDTNDKGNAEALGLNYSAKITYAAVGHGTRVATLEGAGTLVFESGKVDFSPQRQVMPGAAPNPYPPKAAVPGSVGDANYSPLVQIQNAGGAIYNAPIVAFNAEASQIEFPNGSPDYRLVHDKVLKISPKAGTVTLALTTGFSFARPVLYLSMEANDPALSALEGVTFAPALSDVAVGRDDGAFSAVERIFIFTNGPTGGDNPQRQGLNSALTDGRGPLNILGGIPTVATDYSPLWDANVGEWTADAIQKGYRSRLIDEFQILGFAERGFLTGPGGKPYGSTGMIINCPIVTRFL